MRALKILTLLALSNLPVLSGLAGWPWPAWIAPALSLTALYLLLHILPRREKGAPPRLSILIGGYELVLCAAVSFVIECGLFLWLCLGADRGLSMPRLIAPASSPWRYMPCCLPTDLSGSSPPRNSSASSGGCCSCCFGGCRFSTSSCLGRSAGPPGKNSALRWSSWRPFWRKRRTKSAKPGIPSCWSTASFSVTGRCSTTGAGSPGNCRETAPPCSMAGSNPLPRWRQAQPN